VDQGPKRSGISRKAGSRLDLPQDALDDRTMLHRRTPRVGLLGRQERLYLLPEGVGQAEHTSQVDGTWDRRGREGLLTSPTSHMSAPSPRLMDAPEARPPQSLRPLLLGLTQQLEQAAQFRHAQLDALVVASRFFPCARVTTSTAWASNASVMWRYQAR
jgi:hypothetical protein